MEQAQRPHPGQAARTIPMKNHWNNPARRTGDLPEWTDRHKIVPIKDWYRLVFHWYDQYRPMASGLLLPAPHSVRGAL
jgi:hypothetical protein